jgi:hypothetical protein
MNIHDERLKKALLDYAVVIKREGWEQGERIIEDYEEEIPDFRRWAYAAGILLRAEELLNTKKT